MAKTAIVNPRRRRAKKRRSNPRRRARRYGAAARRPASRRRNPRRRRSRRRNPSVQSVYSSGGYRQQNPGMFDVDHVLEVMPAATGGIWAVRWAMKMAGPFEPVTKQSGTVTTTVPVPGVKHAIAGVLAASMGSGLIGQLLGDPGKAHYAEIAALGFLGDVYMRTRVLDDSQWVRDNLMLSGVDECAEYEEEAEYEEDPNMGADPQYMVGPDGTLYALQGIQADPAYAPSLHGLQEGSALGALQDGSALGRIARPSTVSGFGYA